MRRNLDYLIILISIIINISKAIIILGIVFRVQNWPYSLILFLLGGIPLIFCYILYAFSIPEKDYDWTHVYPELAGMDHDNYIEKRADNIHNSQDENKK